METWKAKLKPAGGHKVRLTKTNIHVYTYIHIYMKTITSNALKPTVATCATCLRLTDCKQLTRHKKQEEVRSKPTC